MMLSVSGALAPSKNLSKLVLRFGVSATALLAFAFFVLLYKLHLLRFYHDILDAQGIPQAANPFSDLAAVLNAVRCAHEGVNVYLPSACMQGGVYNYSPFVLRLGFLQYPAQHLMLSGILLGIVFLTFLSSLPAPASFPELFLRAIATLSPATIFALERANFDVVIFLAVTVGVLFCLRNSALRILGYLTFLLAAAIKFFPAAVLALILREPPRRILLLAGCLIFMGLAFLAYFGAGTLAAIQIIPRAGPLGNDFGAINIPLGLSLLFFPPVPMSINAIAHYHMPKFFELAYWGMILFAVFRAKKRTKKYNSTLQKCDAAPLVFFLAGSILIVFCFFVAQNIVYRDIFLLLVLPGVFAMERLENGFVRAELRKLIAAIVFLMWEEAFRVAIIHAAPHVFGNPLAYGADILFWLCREFVWWWTIIQLMSFIFAYIEAAIQSARGMSVAT